MSKTSVAAVLPPQAVQPVAFQSIDCINPATGQLLGRVPMATRDEVSQVVRAARAAQRSYASSTFKTRRRLMQRIRNTLLENSDSLCKLVSEVSGKTREHALVGEVWPMLEKLTWLIHNGERALRPEPVSSGLLVHKRARIEFAPLGVVGAIIPWNYPLLNTLNASLPALFAGNAVVQKPSEYAAWATQPIVELIHHALRAEGLNTNLFTMVNGAGEIGEALIDQGLDGLVFIGSPHIGRKVLEAAAKKTTPVVLELGGKDPFIVLEDADLDRAIEAALVGVLVNCGQNCVAAERILVHHSVAVEFERRLQERVKALRQGSPAAGRVVDVGSMANEMQLCVVQKQVDEAVKEGARLVCGGHRSTRLPGFFFEPTLLADVTPDMSIMRQETFGPVLLLTRFKDEAEAIEIANGVKYSLGASVFSRDAERARKFAGRIKSGMVAVNDFCGMTFMAPELPFGGVGASGYGRLNGVVGLRACCQARAVLEDRWGVGLRTAVFPVDANSYANTRRALKWVYSSVGDWVRSVTFRM